jgi:adenine specific DNA methylase Mod
MIHLSNLELDELSSLFSPKYGFNFPRHNHQGLILRKLALLGQETWNDDEIKKRHFVQNAQNPG